jgi:hypothetical protein
VHNDNRVEVAQGRFTDKWSDMTRLESGDVIPASESFNDHE